MSRNKRIRLLYTINDLGIGGAQRITADVIKGLSARYSIAVANLNVAKKYEIEKELLSKGVRVFRCPYASKLDVRRFIWLYSVIRSFRPHILHSNLWFASLLTACIGKAAGCRRIISTEHNTTTFISRPWWYILFARLFLRLNTAHIVVSQAIARAISQHSQALSKKTELIYNGIDLKIFNPSGYSSQEDGKEFRVGTLVRDDPRKGFRVFQECAKLAADKRYNIKFVTAHWSDTGSIDFIDFVKLNGARIGVAKYMRGLDVFVLPSFEEGLGLVLLEAMAMGAAVIASNIGGMREIIQDNQNGMLFRVGDKVDLLKKIEYIMQNQDHATQMKQRARQRVEEDFSLAMMLERYDQFYRKILDNE